MLDQDVDVAVAAMLRRYRHKVFTAGMAGQSKSKDNDLSVYADDRRAALITHDREFTQRRREKVFGKHIYLDCNDWEAADILCSHLTGVVELIGSREHICVRVSRDRVTPYPSRWNPPTPRD